MPLPISRIVSRRPATTEGAVSIFNCRHSKPLSSNRNPSICFFGEFDREAPSPDSDHDMDEPVLEAGGGKSTARGVRFGSTRRRRLGVVPSMALGSWSDAGGLGSCWAAFRLWRVLLLDTSEVSRMLGMESSQALTRWVLSIAIVEERALFWCYGWLFMVDD